MVMVLPFRVVSYSVCPVLGTTQTWLCTKIPLSAKRVALGVWFGGMFRGMFRRYDSGYDSPHLLYHVTVYTKSISYIKGLSPTPSWRLGLFSERPSRPWHSKARFGYDSGHVSGMIRGMTRAGDYFCKNKVEGQSFVKYKTKKMHILCTRSFWWHCLTALAPSIPRKTWPTGK